ncbi:hypothetical protein L2D00_11400 [Hyphomonadaceae bacterium BL14]|nr:hypothetical protein L2D00_11400 [Hyphomonadaceae bacterium BL14]
MSALYTITYEGLPASVGWGSLYIGHGSILGADAGGGRYQGTYQEAAGRLKGTVLLTAAPGTPLVTGQPVTGPIELSIDWPDTFTQQVQTVMVQGHPVRVALERVGNIPV